MKPMTNETDEQWTIHESYHRELWTGTDLKTGRCLIVGSQGVYRNRNVDLQAQV